jgi:hypothetical protein
MVDRPVTIRLAHALDAEALATLAQLDSSPQLAAPVIVAELDGELRAALSLADAGVIADPFHRTGELVDLLRVRGRQLRGQPHRGQLAGLIDHVRLDRCLPASKILPWRSQRRTPARSA